MRAVQVLAGGGVGIREVAQPDPGPGEVLIAVAGAGLCHSDVSISQHPDRFGGGPFTLGHEISGRVAGWGRGVDGLEEGMPVVVQPMWTCGRCRHCRRGHSRLCGSFTGPGMGADGGMATHMVVRDSRYLVPIHGIDPVDAAPLADAALAPYHAIRSTAVWPGAVTVVIGAGGLGHVAVQILATVYAAIVVAVEPDGDRRQLAEGLGAHLAIHPDDDVVARVRDLDPDGAVAVYDFVGSDDTLAVAAAVVAPLGSIVLVGTALGTLPFNLLSVPPECRVHSSVGGETWELAEVVALARAGRIAVHTNRVTLDDIVTTLPELERGTHGVGRTVAVPS